MRRVSMAVLKSTARHMLWGLEIIVPYCSPCSPTPPLPRAPPLVLLPPLPNLLVHLLVLQGGAGLHPAARAADAAVQEGPHLAIFAEDVRAKLVLGDDIKQLPPPAVRATRARPHFPRFSVTPAAHANILQLISPLEEGTVDRNDPHRLTGFRFFDEEDQMQYIVEGFCCEEASAGGKKGRTFTIRNVTTNGLETMWEDSLREYLEEAKAKAGAHDIEDSDEGDAED